MASKSKDKKTKVSKTESLIKIYSFLHIALILYASYVSYRCNNGIKIAHMGLAVMCPHLYLIYIAATKGLTFCLIGMESSEDYEATYEEE